MLRAQHRTPSIYSQDDPLTLALRPPPQETDAERRARLQREANAKRISEKIDEELRQEREKLKKRKSDVKVCRFLRVMRGASAHSRRDISYFFSVNPSLERAPFRSNSSSCTAPAHWNPNASPGE